MSKKHIGDWFAAHYRTRQAQTGTFKAATQMRKQGVPLHVALAVLAGRVA